MVDSYEPTIGYPYPTRGTDKSVKYLVTFETKKGNKATVCCCNKCALGFTRAINRE